MFFRNKNERSKAKTTLGIKILALLGFCLGSQSSSILMFSLLSAFLAMGRDLQQSHRLLTSSVSPPPNKEGNKP